MNPSDNTKAYSAEDLAWADESVKNVVFGCVLNIKLYHAGICRKLILDMNHDDLVEYTHLIGEILDEHRK